MKRLPDTELEVMKALWAKGEAAARSELEDRIATAIIDSYDAPVTQIHATAEGDQVVLRTL